MPASAQLPSVLYALGAFLSWGVSDFVGGYAARRFNSFYLAALGHFSGTVLMVAIAIANHETIPSLVHLRWAFAAGVCGGIALALFYRALSQGNMGLAAPVSAVLGAALPVAFGILTEGLPKALPIAGFAFALVGIWLVSRPEGGRRPEGLGLAMISGVGFALFFIFIKQAGSGSALWIAAASRSASLVATGLITLTGRKFTPRYPFGFGLGLLAGCIDVTGTFLFVRASQMGRLDTAVIISSLYPALTVILARIFLGERFTRWKTVGMIAALVAVPLIAAG
ncbi:MAG TPA: DMT family transporter [Terriglobales bacterium]|jgi:drug/metabolite transporter (DMT)-like permease|nr:DMT family transporter [Terriglobales bacterium]